MKGEKNREEKKKKGEKEGKEYHVEEKGKIHIKLRDKRYEKKA